MPRSADGVIDVPGQPSISPDALTLPAVRAAIQKLHGRAAGPDGIPPQLLKCAITPISIAPHELFSGCVPKVEYRFNGKRALLWLFTEPKVQETMP